MTAISEVIIAALLLVGAFLTLVAAFGLIRLPDVYTRNHAASKSATLGVMCIMLATFLYFLMEDGLFSSRLLLGIAFFFITAPVAGHLISRAAYNSGVKMWEQSVRDDLKEKKKQKK
ncbi:monovalent cation/H(+) antiporter subunit G [Domibacillus indicus]|uniref:monovalent cation/H(+) antiporter subunit G n=1 Tax=Domibacillus indicus TaxID=1437523 RepID=UPI000617F672|nr:monovalent cation/H(+) antiporter subunit G [Domibacillus indicus]